MEQEYHIPVQDPFPIFILRGDSFGIDMFNEELLNRLGKTSEQVLHKPFFEVFPENGDHSLEGIFRKVYQTGKRCVAQNISVADAGTGKLLEEGFEVVTDPIKDERGAVTGLIAMGHYRNHKDPEHATDAGPALTSPAPLVTAEPGNRETAERFRAVFENASVGIAITDLGGRFLQVNGAYERITGYTGEELQQFTFTDITHPFDREKNMQEVAEMLAGKIPCFETEKRYLRKDGKAVWMKVNASLIRDEAGNPRNIIGVAENITQEKEAQKQLSESEERFRTLANSIPQLAWMADEKGRIFWYNQRWYDYTGMRPEEALGWGWFNVLHPDMAKAVQKRFQAALAARKPWEDTLLLRGADGTFRWFLSRTQPIPRQSGTQNGGWFGTNTDITDQRRTEEDLQEQKEQLQMAMEVGELGYFDYYPKTGQLIWSDRSRDIFGQSLESSTANNEAFVEAVHPDDKEKSTEAILHAMDPRSGGRYESQYRIRRLSDGSLRWIRSKGRVFFDAEGKPERFTGVNQDVTEQMRAEELLKDSEQRFRQLADQTPIWVFMGDENFQVTYANRELLHYFGLSHFAQLTSAVFEQSVHPDDIAQLQKTYREAAARLEPFDSEIRVKNVATDGYEWHLLKGVPRIVKAAFAGFIGTGINIHHQKNLREKLEELVAERTRELQRSNEDLQQFAHVASHDLKEPVRKIKTYANSLQESTADRLNPREKAFLNKVQSAADRMLVMIDGVLTYSTINALEQLFECVDLNEILKNIETDLEVVISHKGARVHYENLPRVQGAPVLLYQLFYNLINNSLKFAKAGTPPVIFLSGKVVRRHGKAWFQILVCDNGIGFEQKYAEKIFGTFTRLNAKDKYEGTGLGLALCKKIVERHGGTISATARAEEGASFEILLPLSTSAARAKDSHSVFH